MLILSNIIIRLLRTPASSRSPFSIAIADTPIIPTRDEGRVARFRVEKLGSERIESFISVENDVIESSGALSDLKWRSRRSRGGNYVGSNCPKVLRPKLVGRGPSEFRRRGRNHATTSLQSHLRVVLLCRGAVIQRRVCDVSNTADLTPI